MSAAGWLRKELGGRIAIGEHIRDVQRVFKGIFNLEPAFATDGSQFDHLFRDGERFPIGTLEAQVIAMPGHTPACVAYRVGDAVFVGDTLFMPDVGTARCDFPGGDAGQLYRSIRKVLALPPLTRIFVCHDYPPAGRPARWETSVAEQRAHNIHVHDGVAEAEFVSVRQARDATLEEPKLMQPAVKANIQGGA
jgi:glyoxylase-like metal-dependent hydrolase (beta-lactamase superfamily II)